MRARAASGLRSVVIRAGDFFGGGRGSWLDLVIVKSLAAAQAGLPRPAGRAARLGLPARPGARLRRRGGARRPAGLRRRCTSPATRSPARNCWRRVERAAAALGLRAGAAAGATARMPWALIRAGGLVVPIWRELAEMSYLWRVPHALDGSALNAAVGALPATPIDAALRAALLDLGLGAERRQRAGHCRLIQDRDRFPTHPGAIDEHPDPDAEPAAPARRLQARRPPARGLGLLLIAEALLSFAPVAILGAAIGWPASLDKPAAEQLAAIAANADAVALGYGVYLLYSILVAPFGALSMALSLGTLGVVSAALLAALALPALRIDVQVPVAVAGSMLSLWMLGAGVWPLRARRA